MPVNTETLNKNLYDVLNSRGYDPVSLDSKGDPTDEIEQADVFRFTYKNEGGVKGGQGWATNENNELVLYIDDNFTKSPDFENFTRFMKRWAQKRLLGFKITNKDRLLGDMKKRTVMKQKEEQLNEGYHALGKQKSYNDSIPTVKLILQHTRQLEEGEQRFRNIAKIFVENAGGERFLLPTNRPGLARVFARHIAEGGTPYDDKGKHITGLVEDYAKMAGFVRATRNGQFNESALKLVNEGLMHYNNLRMTLQGLTSHRGYNKYFEDYIPVLNEEMDDDVSLNELFVQETLDPRIESVMPILKRLNRNINEMNEVAELDEWAKSITEVEDETTKTLAEPADKMLDEAPGAETLARNDDTEEKNLKAFGLAEGPADEPVYPDDDADDKRFDDIDEEIVNELSPETKKAYAAAAKQDKEFNTKGMNQALHRAAKDQAPGRADWEDEAEFFKSVNAKRDRGLKRAGAEVDENLDANQKRAKQLGPTTSVGKNEKNLRGMAVGANESIRATLDKITEMDKSQKSSDRGGESSGNPYAKGGKATPIPANKAKKDFLGVLNKSVAKANQAKQDTDKKVAQHMKEGQDDLDAILRIVHK
jgi:hypothetical protein